MHIVTNTHCLCLRTTDQFEQDQRLEAAQQRFGAVDYRFVNTGTAGADGRAVLLMFDSIEAAVRVADQARRYIRATLHCIHTMLSA
jgi:hypothetical protein